MNAERPWVSLILPVHNQGEHIRDIALGHLDVLDGLDRAYEMLIVLNGCSDSSSEVCRGLAASNEHVRTIELPESGWGRAVKAGVAAGAGELLCYTNAARTTPEILRLMLLYAAAYPGVVLKANRRIRDSWRRRLGSLLYNLECRALFDVPAWDVNGTPKVFPREFDALLNLERDDDLIDIEFIAVARREDYPLVEVPILATERRGGRSTTNYGSAVRLYLGAYRMSREAGLGPRRS